MSFFFAQCEEYFFFNSHYDFYTLVKLISLDIMSVSFLGFLNEQVTLKTDLLKVVDFSGWASTPKSVLRWTAVFIDFCESAKGWRQLSAERGGRAIHDPRSCASSQFVRRSPLLQAISNPEHRGTLMHSCQVILWKAACFQLGLDVQP